MAKKKMTFEEALKRMEDIVDTLENEEVALDKSIKLYKEGMELSFLCRDMLSSAEKEVMMLSRSGGGEIREIPFVPEEE